GTPTPGTCTIPDPTRRAGKGRTGKTAEVGKLGARDHTATAEEDIPLDKRAQNATTTAPENSARRDDRKPATHRRAVTTSVAPSDAEIRLHTRAEREAVPPEISTIHATSKHHTSRTDYPANDTTTAAHEPIQSPRYGRLGSGRTTPTTRASADRTRV